MKREQVDIYRTLREHGIDPLTREACGLGMRTLCDIDEQGQEILDEFFGGIQLTSYGANKSNAKGFMLPGSVMRNLAVFIKIHADGADCVVDINHQGKTWSTDILSACYDYDIDELREYITRLEDFHQGHYRIWERSREPGNGTRNKHIFTGRMR